jgi:hypothetical protein
MTATEVEIISHNLNVEEIWKKGLIGIRLRKSHDQNQFAEEYSPSITSSIRESQ